MRAILQQQSLGEARAQFDGEVMTVSTGVVERAWRVIFSGLATMSLRVVGIDQQWIDPAAAPACDWKLIGVIDERSRASVGAAMMQPRCGVSYTTDHLEVEVPVVYEREGFELRYRIWVYPGAPGVRTQLSVRALRSFNRGELPGYLGPSYAERLPLAMPPDAGRAAGYYNDTQHRNYNELPILAEAAVDVPRGQTNEWASVLQLRTGAQCLTLVKESHKCVNQAGVDTGAFVVSPTQVLVTGLCLTANDYGGSSWHRQEKPRECWATWAMLTPGGFDDARVGLRAFDRRRYPFRPERDRVVMSNTWGSRAAGDASRSAAEQNNVIAELQSAADLGIDMVQIDDGWQCGPGVDKPYEVDWTPSRARFPDGWRAVGEASRRTGVELGLWQPWWTPLDAILRNHFEGGFRRFKLDFMVLRHPDEIEMICTKARQLIDRASPCCGINWDATENAARMGYYFGRDHGNIYLANRPAPPPGQHYAYHVAYRPHLTLREAWHLARYMNLNQVQITIQNVDGVDPAFSNAQRYGHAYAFAIAMMGVPIFFQETHLYSEEARSQLRPMVALYKQHRDRMFEGFVEPVGNEPDDASWTGFHNAHPSGQHGYFTIFREMHNEQPETQLALPSLAGKRMRLTDLVSNVGSESGIRKDGTLSLKIGQPGGFLFLRYELIGPS